MDDDTEIEMPKNGGSSKQFTVPLAIIVAGALVAGAVYYTNRPVNTTGQQAAAGTAQEAAEVSMRPVSADDHILGNPSASVIIVEYSDTECPFCKDFHGTMHRVIDTYGRDGQVAWVYRHFPIPQLHSNAPKQAEATECAAELGGNTAFWSYVDRIFEITPSNNGLDMSLLPVIAEEIGLDRQQFENCLNSSKHAETVQADFDDAVASGGRGTPHSIMVVGDELIPIPGAQPFASLQSAIEQALASHGDDPTRQAVPAL